MQESVWEQFILEHNLDENEIYEFTEYLHDLEYDLNEISMEDLEEEWDLFN